MAAVLILKKEAMLYWTYQPPVEPKRMQWEFAFKDEDFADGVCEDLANYDRMGCKKCGYFGRHGERLMTKRDRKPKLTDAERYNCFVDAAIETEASQDAADSEKAFERVSAQPGPRDR